MNKDHVKGSFNETKGRVKEEVGHAFGADKTEAEGITDQIKGKVQQVVGDVKDAAKHVVDKVLHHDAK